MMGVAPNDMVAALLDAGTDIIGTNCGNGMERMVDIVKEIRANAPEIPILVHANAGAPVNVNGVDTFPETPEDMKNRVPPLVEAGANIVGGCCGTTPIHIAAIKAAVGKIMEKRK
jgi:5-methyltetrahydrofolate--homocysteine methyltransferase